MKKINFCKATTIILIINVILSIVLFFVVPDKIAIQWVGTSPSNAVDSLFIEHNEHFLHRYVLVIVSEEPALESAALSNLTEEVSQGILLEQASAECILNTAGVAVGDNDVVQSQSALSGVSLAVWYSSSLGSSSFHQNWWLT